MGRRLLGAVCVLLLLPVLAAAQAALMPGPIQQYFDSSGNPLANGSLTFYAAGTTTPLAAYADASLATPLSNPLTLNSAGRTTTPVFLSSGSSYKILLKNSSGSTIWTVDNVAGGTYLAQQAALPQVQTTTSTGTQNDFVLSCSTTAVICVLRVNNASDVTFTGFSALSSGSRLIVVAVGAGNVYLSPQSGGSTPAYRLINVATSSTTPLAANAGRAEYVYDSTTARWRLVSHEQGAWITPTYAGTDYTASAGTWTVGSGDVSVYRYYLTGRILNVQLELANTDVSTTPATLRLLVPNTFTLNSISIYNLIRVSNGGAAVAVGIAQPVSNQIYFASTVGGAAWSASAASTYVQGFMSFEVN